MPRILITRAGAALPLGFVGKQIQIPAPPDDAALDGVGLDEEALAGLLVGKTPEDALNTLMCRLGHGGRLAGAGQVEVLEVAGLVEPSAWERHFVAWAAGRLGVAVPELEVVLPEHPLREALTDPLAPWPAKGPPVLEAEEVDLEALAGSRWLRERWLDSLKGPEDGLGALDEMLVLVPDDPARLRVWSHALARQGLPVRSPVSRRLSEHPLARWLLTLVRLSGWRKHGADRDDLRVLLGSPFTTRSEHYWRADGRELERSLRRPSVSPELWDAHMGRWFAGQRQALRERDLDEVERTERLEELGRREAAARRLSHDLLEALPAPEREDFFRALLQVVHPFHERGSAPPRGLRPVLPVWLACRAVLEGLSDASERGQGAHQRARALAAALGARTVPAVGEHLHGVRVVGWSCWDGLGARFVVLSGLEERGWPAAPVRPSRREQQIVDALGLDSPEETLRRQARVAVRAAAASTEALLLTYSKARLDGGATFPGALLLSHPQAASQRFGVRQAVLAHPSQAVGPEDLLGFPAPQQGATANWRRVDAAAAHARKVAVARAPTKPTAPGPYTGRVGVEFTREQHSASSLEALGQCGTQYLLSKVLGVERPEEASALLDPLEAGTFVHDAFAAAALSAIAVDGAWDLRAADPALEAEHLEARMADIEVGLARTRARLLTDNPTLSDGMVDQIAARWRRSVAAYLGHAVAEKPSPLRGFPQPPEVEVLDKPELAGLKLKELSTYRALQERERALPGLVASYLALPPEDRKTLVATEKWLMAHEEPLKLNKAKRDALHKAVHAEGQAGADSWLEERRSELDHELGKAREKLEETVRAHWRKARTAFPPPRVVAAEWGFGHQYAGEGPRDPRSAEAPLIVETASGPLALMGRIDRVDGDAPREGDHSAIVDYKSGKGKGDSRLLEEIGQGLHLQLPLYARALRELGPAVLPELGAPVGGTLLFLRHHSKNSTQRASVWLEDEMADAEGNTCSHAQVLNAHLNHAAWRLRAGSYPLAPRACPLERDKHAYCDHQQICGYVPGARLMVQEEVEQPVFTVASEAKEERSDKKREIKLPGRYQASATHDSVPEPLGELDLPLVRDLERDVLLTAGAGAGKTYNLTSRYCAAVAAGVSPNDILAITFTRKATGEMRSRVRLRLREEPPAGLSGERLRSALLEVGTAPILTVDAFVQRVAAELSEEAEAQAISPDADRWRARWLQSRLLEEVDALQEHPDLRKMLEAMPWRTVQQTLGALLSRPERLVALRGVDSKELAQRWLDAFASTTDELMADADRCVAVCEALEARAAALGGAKVPAVLAKRRAEAQTFRGLVERMGWKGALLGWAHSHLRNAPKNVPEWNDFAVVRSRWTVKDKSVRRLADAFLSAVQRVDGEDPASWDEDTLPEALLPDAELALAGVAVASRWLPEIEANRTAAGAFSFDDLLAQALVLLGKGEGSASPERKQAFAERYPLRHVLVDELQDTNGRQVALIDSVLELLGEYSAHGRPRRFAVGDPKQSIYRFRSAEVDVFQAMLDATPSEEHGSLVLGRRSHPDLTRSIDRLFARLFDASLDPQAAVPWEPLAPKVLQEDVSDEGPRVELLLGDAGGRDVVAESTEDDDGEGDDAVEPLPISAVASAPVIRRILRLRREHPEQSAVVLVHSGTRAAAWGELLQEAGVPAWVQGGRGLLSTPAVVPLMQVLDALESEDDDLAWAGILRGPLVGISDPALFALRHGHGLLRFDGESWAPRGRRVHLSALRALVDPSLQKRAANGALAFDPERAAEAMGSRYRKLFETDAQRLAALGGWWSEVRRHWGYRPVSETVERLITLTGYEAALRRRAEGHEPGVEGSLAARRDLSRLLDLRRLLATLPEAASPGETLRRLRALATENNDPAAGGGNLHAGAAVTVTVFHQAKGLEWDVVILPEPEKATVKSRTHEPDIVRVVPPGEEERLLPVVRVEKSDNYFASTGTLSAELVKRATLFAERAESRRLMYVAMTRARERLILGTGLSAVPEENLQVLGEVLSRQKRTARLAGSSSWRDDLVLGLQLRVEPEKGTASDRTVDSQAPVDLEESEAPRLTVDRGVWREGVDFVWVHPQDQEVDAAEMRAVPSSPWPLAARLREIHSPRIEVQNPSSAVGEPTAVPRWRTAGKPGDLAPGEVDALWGSHARAGDALHAALERWGYRGALSREKHVGSVLLGVSCAESKTDWVEQVIRAGTAAQPALLARLTEAAAMGRLWHEVALWLPGATPTQRLRGSVDLLWQEPDGRWHLLDYKSSEVPTAEKLDEKTREYHAQVDLYRRTLDGRLPGGVASWGLWYVRGGVVTWWERGE